MEGVDRNTLVFPFVRSFVRLVGVLRVFVSFRSFRWGSAAAAGIR